MNKIPDYIWKQMTEREQLDASLFLPLYTVHEGKKATEVYSHNTILKKTAFNNKMIYKYKK